MFKRDFEGDLVDEHGNMFNARTIAATGTYDVWVSMKQRCFNSRCPKYPDYGGRGITVCERWLIFNNFYEDMGDKPEELTLERVNNDGDYEPNNCKWATRSEQNRNRRPPWYFRR